VNAADPGLSGRIEPGTLFPDRRHGRRCLCVCCGTADHDDACLCFWCEGRRRLEAEFRARVRAHEREPVLTNEAAEHVARLGLTRRELAREVGCSLGTASRLSHAGNRVSRETVERVLAL
jgi:hypothetical protein